MPENNKNLNMRWSNDSTQSNFSNKQSKYCSLSQSKEFIVFPSNIRLSEEILKMSGRGLSSSSSEDVFKTASRRLDQDEYIFYRAGKEMSTRINPYSQKSGTNPLKLTNIRLTDILYSWVMAASSTLPLAGKIKLILGSLKILTCNNNIIVSSFQHKFGYTFCFGHFYDFIKCPKEYVLNEKYFKHRAYMKYMRM